MNKVKIILLMLSLFILVGCGKFDEVLDTTESIYHEYREGNPMRGMDENEKILFVIHEMYPEHQFALVEKLGTNGDYAILEDENGLQFKVDRVYQLASNQIQMHDEYIYQSLLAQDFIKKARKVVESHGYKLEVDEENLQLEVEINIVNSAIDADKIIVMIQEVLALAEEIPNNQGSPYHKTEFSTGEANYYSIPYSEDISFAIYWHEDENVLRKEWIERDVWVPCKRIWVDVSKDEVVEEDLKLEIQQKYNALFIDSYMNTAYEKEKNRAEDNIEERIYTFTYSYDNPENIARFATITDEVTKVFYEAPKGFDGDSMQGDWVREFTHPEHEPVKYLGEIYTENTIEVYTAQYDYSIEDKEAFKIDLETDLRNSIGDGVFADGEVVEFVSIEEYPHEKHEIFRVTIKEPYGFTSEQYYIMGDKKFALVEITTNKDIPIYEEAALQIIDSIEWR